MKAISPELAFVSFAILLGGRDVGSDLLLLDTTPESRTCLAFLICATISLLSFTLLIVSDGGVTALVQKVRNRNTSMRILFLGVGAAVVYLVTFEMIGRVGAGLFDLFDYGLAPILTVIIGIVAFGEGFKKRLIIAVIMYVGGLVLLLWHQERFGWTWLAVAVLSPIGTATSDGLTKWLLEPRRGGLSRSELLLVRFLPATIVIFIWAIANGQSIHLHDALKSVPLAIFGGFAPLWLLCTGLGRSALSKYAIWEFLIPATAFLGTLPWRPDALNLFKGIGAVLIVCAVIVHELKFRGGKSSGIQTAIDAS